MERVAIVSACRVGTGKYGGQWSRLTPSELAAVVIKEAVQRARIDPRMIEDVIMGNLYAQHGNIARVASLEAGLPIECGATVVDRQCASGSQAIYNAALNISAGNGDAYVACGMEHMTREPWQLDKPTVAFQRLGPAFLDTRLTNDAWGNDRMGVTAENVARLYKQTRRELDEFAYESQKRAAKAISLGLFREEIVPVEVTSDGKTQVVDQDETVRPNVTMEQLAKLPPAFVKDGVCTAGNSCPWSDGAAAMVMMAEGKARELGIEPLGFVKSFAVAGLDPRYMGLGPIYAVPKALKRAGLTISDLDVIELNEAFASQVLACVRELRLPYEKVNPNGGAIALGHPLGATGTVLSVKILYHMKCNGLRYGCVTMCCGGGQGAAIIFERDV